MLLNIVTQYIFYDRISHFFFIHLLVILFVSFGISPYIVAIVEAVVIIAVTAAAVGHQ